MDDKRIITATLADIYLQQGHLEKALEIYEKLVRKEPDNDFYKKRCHALRKELKEKYNTGSLRKILMKKIW
ncbi:MAG TPA: tetratricopeptide repeat protein [Syntrophorhabdaceae bacterium]|nr:tetratricopeptide repeat protein [Syntrophorhabdaceae bacterium]HOL05511.1 tetratricopeptide repeat protein [Syntrophorhabdaceae bacterium]HON85448.1 tetratricopeptide repeat protein [Syntrophorhabdaceae bacterium]HOT41431.1 tetratricopeptide repeat protein [Syntrophorhabdaceae bacterium]HPC66880.1 tetratricopeptide repeat protein [Syntrophorhabdaceae bacterium]